MIRVVDITPVLEASILADNDVFFVPIEVTGVFQNGPVELTSIIVLDGDDQATEFDLVFSNADITLGTLNAGVSVSDADAAKIIGAVSFLTTDAVDLINSTLFKKTSLGLLLTPGATSSLWVSGIVRSGTPTYTASGMKIKLGFK